MDFFERQRTVRNSSAKLVLLFVLAVVLIIVVIDAAVLLLFFAQDSYATTSEIVGTAIVVSFLVGAVIGGTSLVRYLMLRATGGAGVARKLGGVPLEQLPPSPELTRYRNVVEEVAIASATPVPALFVLPNEPGINAFAAGSSPADAAVAVTRGTLERLNRDELQAVIGHEFSHIVNGDMRLSMRLIGVLAGITALGVVGRVLLHTGGGGRRRSGGKNDGGAPLIVLGLVILLVGWIGLFFARLIKAAVSRQREYLADASAIQYTRQTEGLAGALKKIGGLSDGSQLHSGQVEDVSHMLFGEGMNFASMFATHPPLPDRIRAIDPSFRPAEIAELKKKWHHTPPHGLREDAALGLAAPGTMPPPPPSASPSPAGRVSAGVGAPSEQSFLLSAQLLSKIPEPLLDAAHRPELVYGLVYGLLLSTDPHVRQAQYRIVADGHGKEIADQAWQAGIAVDRLDSAAKLPLAQIAFPALRHHSKDEIRTVIAVVGELIHADRKVSVFEYCLGTLLWTQLSEFLTGRPPWGRHHHRRLKSVQPAAATLLSVVARVGHHDDAECAAAFAEGVAVLGDGLQLTYAPPEELNALDTIWGQLDDLEGEEKARLVGAIVATVHADRQVTTAERELVRTVCGVLHCPIPPEF